MAVDVRHSRIISGTDSVGTMYMSCPPSLQQSQVLTPLLGQLCRAGYVTLVSNQQLHAPSILTTRLPAVLKSGGCGRSRNKFGKFIHLFILIVVCLSTLPYPSILFRESPTDLWESKLVVGETHGWKGGDCHRKIHINRVQHKDVKYRNLVDPNGDGCSDSSCGVTVQDFRLLVQSFTLRPGYRCRDFSTKSRSHTRARSSSDQRESILNSFSGSLSVLFSSCPAYQPPIPWHLQADLICGGKSDPPCPHSQGISGCQTTKMTVFHKE